MNNYYCVTIYDNKDENYHESYEYPTKLSALRHALDFEENKIPNQYIEVWQKNSEGLYGSYGRPIYKSDDNGLYEKIIPPPVITLAYPELDEIVNEIGDYIGYFINYKIAFTRLKTGIALNITYRKQYILAQLLHKLEEFI